MEVEVLEEKFKWEARRVAAAFGVAIMGSPVEAQITPESAETIYNIYRCHINQFRVSWAEEPDSGFFVSMSIVVENVSPNNTGLVWANRQWGVTSYGQSCVGLMQRGLYCLGFAGDFPFSHMWLPAQLPILSCHERLELRLTLPRGFWPQRWLDEEETQA